MSSRVRRQITRRAIGQSGFWFVDIPRTSSSSIRAQLGQRYGVAHGKSSRWLGAAATDQLVPDHTPVRDMIQLLGEECWSELFTFSVVRNPWDRALSLFRWRQRVGNIPSDMDFDAYLRMLRDDRDHSPYHGHRFCQLDFLTDERGDIAVDFVMRFERRRDDFRRLRERSGIDLDADVHLMRTATEPGYARHFTPDTRRMVAELYAPDIEAFGYSFDEDTV